MQALFKNPLASPDLIGVSTGGAVGAVAAIFLGWSLVSPWLMPAAAFAGALAAAALVYALGTRAAAPTSPRCFWPAWPSAPSAAR